MPAAEFFPVCLPLSVSSPYFEYQKFSLFHMHLEVKHSLKEFSDVLQRTNRLPSSNSLLTKTMKKSDSSSDQIYSIVTTS